MTDVLVDGVPYGGVRSGGTIEIELEPGNHQLTISNKFKGLQTGGAVIINPGQNTECLISFGVMGGLKVDV